MPQTEEHLQILAYLGINRAVIALTKIDLIQDERRVIATIHEKLRDTPFADAPIVPTSVVTGRGFDNLNAVIAQVLAGTPLPRDIGKPRLPVDRVFTLRGIGTVVTGTLTGGALRRGQSVVVQPSGKVARIRNIQSHNCDVERGVPGTRTALNLSDVAALDDVRRGDVITLADFGGPSDVLDVALEVSSRAHRPLKDGSQVHVHHGSSNVRAKVALSPLKKLAPGEQALAQLRLEANALVFAGDRFVLRDSAGQNTLAGGAVLDPDPGRKVFRSEPQLNFLRHRAESPGQVTSFVASQIARDQAVRRVTIAAQFKFQFSGYFGFRFAASSQRGSRPGRRFCY
jgi:selenocysteine-specific elongation factor